MECPYEDCDSLEFTQDGKYKICVECGTILETLSDAIDIDDVWEQFEGIKRIQQSEERVLGGSLCLCHDLSEIEGNLICTECGEVKETRVISDEKDWNNYTDGMGALENKSRCANPSISLNPYFREKTYRQMGHYEEIRIKQCQECKKPFHEYKDTKCANCGSREYKWKVRKYDPAKIHLQLNYNHKENACNLVHQLIDNVCANKYPEEVTRVASLLWNEVMKSDKLTRGGVRNGLIACCIHYACLEVGCRRAPGEIRQDMHNLNNTQFNQGDNEFREIFEFSERWKHLITKHSRPEDFIYRYCSMLELDFAFAQRCVDLSDKYKLFQLPVMPKSAAAAIICYQRSREKIKLKTKSSISTVLKVCIPTLSKTVKKIKKRIAKYDAMN